jgi:hypothetical protein
MDPRFQVGVNAIANSSVKPIGVAEIIAILSTGEGPGHLVRALFEDCSVESLDRMALAANVSPQQLRAAYRRARTLHHARNAELEAEDLSF